ncbi:MAG TPA: hypothetical protein P5531_01360 [Bacteroidales bacterium]|nr:hypothetical protein [Bacteroidales bacterium]HSA42302.1 hypothetical protein [Bacteroidales bacterium]
MEGFSYHNIFESKGIQYIAIIIFFMVLIPFWLLLNKSNRIGNKIREGFGVLSSKILKLPQGLFFYRNHTWAYLEKTGNARVGLDEMLLHLTGEVRLESARKSGDQVSRGDLIATLSRDDRQLSIYSPISGQITDVNEVAASEPETLHRDPYGEGWVYKIKPSDWIAETQQSFLAEKAVAWSGRELTRIKDFMAGTSGEHHPGYAAVVLQDGGEIMENALSELPGEAWQKFQQEFLSIA